MQHNIHKCVQNACLKRDLPLQMVSLMEDGAIGIYQTTNTVYLILESNTGQRIEKHQAPLPVALLAQGQLRLGGMSYLNQRPRHDASIRGD